MKPTTQSKQAEKKHEPSKQIATNKKAWHNYFISDEIVAGIALEGCEVKSIRNGHISLTESFVQISNGELFLKNAYIKPYEQAVTAFLPDSKRNRKLLLKKSEIMKLEKKAKIDGYTIIPLKVFITRNLVKVEIGLGKGKKLYDKRATLKEKAITRSLQRYKH